MKVTAASDWRETIPFETPMIVSSVIPGDPARCSVCGGDSELRPRTELWVVKHRHPNHHSGYVRFYCQPHLSVVEPRARPVEVRRSPARGERSPAVRRTAAADHKPRAMCPDCFVEISATGMCGMCGNQVMIRSGHAGGVQMRRPVFAPSLDPRRSDPTPATKSEGGSPWPSATRPAG